VKERIRRCSSNAPEDPPHRGPLSEWPVVWESMSVMGESIFGPPSSKVVWDDASEDPTHCGPLNSVRE